MPYRLCLLLCLWAVRVCGQGVDDELLGRLIEGKLIENTTLELGSAGLVIDGTRTKIGRDFYESFYQQWNDSSVETPSTTTGDSTSRKLPYPSDFNLSDYVITIEDLPLPGNGFNSIVSIMIDDQLIWQQFVPARRDIVDEYATYAVATIQAYLAEQQSVKNLLGDEADLDTSKY